MKTNKVKFTICDSEKHPGGLLFGAWAKTNWWRPREYLCVIVPKTALPHQIRDEFVKAYQAKHYQHSLVGVVFDIVLPAYDGIL